MAAFRYRLRVAEVIAEAPTVTSIRMTGRAARPAARAAGAVLPLALPDRRVLVDGASVLALGRARRTVAPDQRQGRRRPHRADALDPGRHARRRRGPVRRRSPSRCPARPEGAADRRRDRDHAGPRARRDDGRRRRRHLPRPRPRRTSFSRRAGRARGPPRRRAALRRRRPPVGRGPRPALGAHLRELVPDLAERDVYLCGPPAMVAAIEHDVRRAGVPRRRSTSSASRSRAPLGPVRKTTHYWTTSREDDLKCSPGMRSKVSLGLGALICIAAVHSGGSCALRRGQKSTRAGRRRQRQEGLHPVLRQVPHAQGRGRARNARPEPRSGHGQLHARRERDRGGRRRDPGRVRPPQRHLQQVYDVAKYVVTSGRRRHARRSGLAPPQLR